MSSSCYDVNHGGCCRGVGAHQVATSDLNSAGGHESEEADRQIAPVRALVPAYGAFAGSKGQRVPLLTIKSRDLPGSDVRTDLNMLVVMKKRQHQKSRLR